MDVSGESGEDPVFTLGRGEMKRNDKDMVIGLIITKKKGWANYYFGP